MVETVGKALIAVGLLLVIGGTAFVVLARLGVTRLPGDVVVRRGNFTLYAPFGLMLLVSVLLTIVLTLFSRR
jgi:multisubunit Na+/H+ antiporter MnhG subunit